MLSAVLYIQGVEAEATPPEGINEQAQSVYRIRLRTASK